MAMNRATSGLEFIDDLVKEYNVSEEEAIRQRATVLDLATVACTSAESYWQPSHVVESAWLEHGPFAFWIVNALKPRVLAELGTHNGFSYFAFCEAISRLHLETNAFALDTWKGDDHAGFYGEDVFDLVTAVNGREYTEFSTLLRGYFDESLDLFAEGSIDLLHIDGRHGYDDVKHDFESWLPKMSDRGVVLFHDIAEHQADFGVWKLWEEVAEKYPSFAFEHGHGLGVAAVGEAVPAAISALFSAGDSEAESIRTFYHQRGVVIDQVWAGQAERAELRSALASVEQQLVTANEAATEAESLRKAVADELAAVLDSAAWKSTAPARWIGSRIPAPVRSAVKSISRGDKP
jgi:hypothetical protein